MPTEFKSGGLRRVDVQVSIFTVIVAVVSCSFLSILSYRVTHRDMINSLTDRVYAIQNFIEHTLDKNTFVDINTPEDMNTPLYAQAHAVFRNAQDVTGVMYLYSGKQNAAGELVYVVDCIDPAAEDFRSPGAPIEAEIAPEMARALRGEEVLPREIKSTDWGKIFIAYLPVHMEDEIVGVIGVEFEATHQYNTYHFLSVITPVAASIISILCAIVARFLFRRISNPLYKDMFNTDYLTGLKSRNAFSIDLANLNARKKHDGVGFYVIDLNYLKQVNDTLGHEAGDVYLRIAARAFREAAGENIAVYRTGGDEFVLISTGDTLEKMARLSAVMAEELQKHAPQWAIPLSFSIGYALFDKAVDADLSATYRRADKIMYERKQEFHAQNP